MKKANCLVIKISDDIQFFYSSQAQKGAKINKKLKFYNTLKDLLVGLKKEICLRLFK